MKFTFDQAIEDFHTRIMYAAKRFHTGILDPSDVYQDVIIALVRAEFRDPPQPVWSIHLNRHVNYEPSHVISFIDSRAKDLVRHEATRQRIRKASDITLNARAAPPRDLDLRIDLLNALAQLSDEERAVIIAAASPPESVVALAESARQQALADRARGRQRMNVHRTKVTMAQIGQALGLSKATVSRALKRGRSRLEATLADRSSSVSPPTRPPT